MDIIHKTVMSDVAIVTELNEPVTSLEEISEHYATVMT
jgi:hypothetical protein